MPDSYVEIKLSALRRNAAAIIAKYPAYTAHIGVVKGDAYGHGMRASQAFCEGGIRCFAVSSLEEAAELRRCTDADILCLEPVSTDRLSEAARLRLILPICDTAYLNAFLSAAQGCRFRVHLQVDAGFNRLGFKDADEITAAVQAIRSAGHTLQGIYQHFATTGVNDRHYDDQIRRFCALTSGIDLSEIPLVHLCSGVTMAAHPKPPFATAARVGLMLYGYDIAPPSYGAGVKARLRALRDNYRRKKYRLTPTLTDNAPALTPAMRYRCRILQIKKVQKGESVGYGASYTAQGDLTLAILPVGYNNGIGQHNNGRVVDINGRLYPVVGEIGMNMLAVKVDEAVSLTDKVTLLGDGVTLGMFSRASGLGLAEALVCVGRCNERIYIDQTDQ